LGDLQRFLHLKAIVSSCRKLYNKKEEMMFLFSSPKAKLIFGENSLRNLGQEASQLGDRVLLVTGKKSMERLGFLKEAIQNLEEKRLQVIHYGKVTPNPTVSMINEGARLAVEKGCNLIVGLGGGSVMDTAKAIAIVAGHSEGEGLSIWDFVHHQPKAKEITSKTLPVIAITSTSGTGSHVTKFCVITNPKTKEKPGIGSEHIFPKLSIVDMRILAKMPPPLTAATGSDVLAHALEALVSKDSTPFSDLYSAEAIRLVLTYLPRAYREPTNKVAREKMALADTYAGWAISTSRTGLPHAMAHPLSGHYPNIAHGLALAVLTPQIMKYNIEKADEATLKKYSLIAEIGDRSIVGSEKEKAQESVKVIEKLLRELNLHIKLKQLGVDPNRFETMAKDAFKYMSGPIRANPVSATLEDVVELYKRCY